MKDHRNADGTYNGVSFMAEISGLSEEEISWAWRRMLALKKEGRSKREIAKTLREENPWRKKA